MQQARTDELYMRRCLQLARCGRQESRPNPMVGAVIVVPEDDGWRIVGEGYHVRCGEGHAEVNAFASVRPDDERLLPTATVYVSLEPCSHHGKTPPCCDLLIRKGVRRVVVGCVDPFARVQGRGIQRLREAGIEVTVGVLERECQWLNRRFFTFHREHRPWIILKWAQTANGFIDREGRPLAISTPMTQLLVHRLRAEEDAIVVGRTTWEREHPQLNVRLWAGRSPERFVLGSQGDSLGSQGVKESRSQDNSLGSQGVKESRSQDDSPVNCQLSIVNCELSIVNLLKACCERSLQSLIVEGGRQTLQSFLDCGLWDELRVETAPWTCEAGTRAPQMPAGLEPDRVEQFDGNTIAHYFNRR